LVPQDPMYVPPRVACELARERFMQLAPDADQIEIKLSENAQFFDCGANLERIICPDCRSEIPLDWWQNRMDVDYTGGGFALAPYSTPCCGAHRTLNDLIYEWPQCFGRFALDVMNPNIGKLDHEIVAEFEKILGERLHVIYQHI
jgi:hypothetical protein